MGAPDAGPVDGAGLSDLGVDAGAPSGSTGERLQAARRARERARCICPEYREFNNTALCAARFSFGLTYNQCAADAWLSAGVTSADLECLIRAEESVVGCYEAITQSIRPRFRLATELRRPALRPAIRCSLASGLLHQPRSLHRARRRRTGQRVCADRLGERHGQRGVQRHPDGSGR